MENTEPKFEREVEIERLKKLVVLSNIFGVLGFIPVLLIYHYLDLANIQEMIIKLFPYLLGMLVLYNLLFLYRYKNLEKVWHREIENERKMQDPVYKKKILIWSILLSVLIIGIVIFVTLSLESN